MIKNRKQFNEFRNRKLWRRKERGERNHRAMINRELKKKKEEKIARKLKEVKADKKCKP